MQRLIFSVESLLLQARVAVKDFLQLFVQYVELLFVVELLSLNFAIFLFYCLK